MRILNYHVIATAKGVVAGSWVTFDQNYLIGAVAMATVGICLYRSPAHCKRYVAI